jgi:hypothetical protein
MLNQRMKFAGNGFAFFYSRKNPTKIFQGGATKGFFSGCETGQKIYAKRMSAFDCSIDERIADLLHHQSKKNVNNC